MKRFTNEKSKTKLMDKNSPISSFPSPDNFSDFLRKRNSYILKNTDLLFKQSFTNNNNDYNNIYDKTKNYLSQKSLNDENKKDSLGKNSNEEDLKNIINNNDNNENIDFKRDNFIRRKTANSNINSFDSFKLNNKRARYLKKSSIKLIKNNDDKIQINNKSKDQNSINEDNKEKIDLNLNSIVLNDTSRKQSVSNNQFIIKEEDENIGSDNSCKNLDFFPKTKKPKKKDINPKKSLEKRITNKIIKKEKEEDNNNKNSKINTEDKKEDFYFGEYNKEKVESLNEMLNSNNSENNNIKILSLKKIIKSNNQDNKIEKLDIFEENNKNDINNLDNNKISIYDEENSKNLVKDILQKTPKLESKSIEMKIIKDIKLENPNKISIKKNISYPKKSKNLVNNYNFKKNNTQKYPLTPKSSSFENNLNYKKNIMPINSDIKLNYNSISINNSSKTYINFPNIIKNFSGNKFKNNYFIKSRDIDTLEKVLNDNKISNKESLNW